MRRSAVKNLATKLVGLVVVALLYTSVTTTVPHSNQDAPLHHSHSHGGLRVLSVEDRAEVDEQQHHRPEDLAAVHTTEDEANIKEEEEATTHADEASTAVQHSEPAPITKEIAVDPLRDRFSAIYRLGAWSEQHKQGIPKSGPGSSVAYTSLARIAVANVIRAYGVKTIADVSCGDMTWMPLVDLNGAAYTGYDIVPTVIEANTQRFAKERPEFSFAQLNAVEQTLPKAYDLIVCRQALQHLTPDEVRKALRRFADSGSRYLLTTTYPWSRQNVEVWTGGPQGVDQFHALNLNDAPYNLPPPLALFLDDVVTEKHNFPSVFDNGKSAKFPNMYFGLWDLSSLKELKSLPPHM